MKWDTPLETVTDHFKQWGVVEKVDMPLTVKNPTLKLEAFLLHKCSAHELARLPGYCFVTFATPAEAALALAKADGATLDGRKLNVRAAGEKQKEPSKRAEVPSRDWFDLPRYPRGDFVA